jgi:RNA polymerase sigma-70 factor (ECF subfamily)
VRATESIGRLVTRAREGDEKSFAELVRLHFRATYSVALAVLGSPADAEDVAQEAFMVAYQKLDTCREPERFSGWVVQIARNRALNALSSRKVAASAAVELGREADGATSMGDPTAWTRERLVTVLSKITSAQREVVLLHDLEGWTHPEIAESMGISEVMSRQHLFVARKSLRALLGQGKEEAGE